MTGYNVRGGRFGNTSLLKDYYRYGAALNAFERYKASARWDWLEIRTSGGREIIRWEASKAVQS